jgi:hypothetical protein
VTVAAPHAADLLQTEADEALCSALVVRGAATG